MVCQEVSPGVARTEFQMEDCLLVVVGVAVAVVEVAVSG